MPERLTRFSIDRPKTVIATSVLLTLLFGLQFPKITIDTDPENMLEPDQPDRVFYNRVKQDFGVRDLIVVGIVDEGGIFRSESLERVARATTEMLKIEGVVIPDVVSLTTTDNVKSSGGFLDIHPVMRDVPQTVDAITALRGDIADNPFLHEKIASDDGTLLALYLPIEEKDMSYRIAGEIKDILSRELLPRQTYHLAGLPIAEDTFGHEMFVQMAVVAPLAFVVILVLVFLMFRHTVFLLPVGMTAMFSVIWAMGLLIGTGNTVHIMSSMIPVFLMPIAILDNIHVISEFFDRYRQIGEKRPALLEAMKPLYRPMLFTSLTSAVGFASLALADIPPVRVFGLFVAFGIIAAWLFSITLVPAIISMTKDEKLKKILPQGRGERRLLLDRLLRPVGRVSFSHPKVILGLAALLLVFAVLGLRGLRINDNPVKWFKKGHPMRLADRLMNERLGGTYMAYVVLEGDEGGAVRSSEVVAYIDDLQTDLEADPIVGKTSSVADIVKRINYSLHDNDSAFDVVPESDEAIGQFLFRFQSSGDPDDLDNFVDRESRKANLWIQMKGGDNEQMKIVEERLAAFVGANQPPRNLTVRWSGLTYINKVWQDLMVFGMLKAILGSFLVVLLLMWIQFRSIPLGLLSMVPLSLAVLFSYGLLGWVGKDYDMPVAVCSSLSLGLGIDFAIHFLQRFKEHYRTDQDLAKTNYHMFGEPGRAIARNAIVISLGFLPLLVSSLTPYTTVGLFFALLMVFTTLSTLLLLPATLRIAGSRILGGRTK